MFRRPTLPFPIEVLRNFESQPMQIPPIPESPYSDAICASQNLAQIVAQLIASPGQATLQAQAIDLAQSVTQNLPESTPNALSELAQSITQAFVLLAGRKLDPAQALPILAASLSEQHRVLLAVHESPQQQVAEFAHSLNATRYELETLFPIPGAPETLYSSGAANEPHVMLSSLTKKLGK